jgi:DNA-directed RNA polymerase subunit RPC12/RpoP
MNVTCPNCQYAFASMTKLGLIRCPKCRVVIELKDDTNGYPVSKVTIKME